MLSDINQKLRATDEYLVSALHSRIFNGCFQSSSQKGFCRKSNSFTLEKRFPDETINLKTGIRSSDKKGLPTSLDFIYLTEFFCFAEDYLSESQSENEISFNVYFTNYQRLKEVFSAFSKVSIEVELKSEANKQVLETSVKDLRIIKEFEVADELYTIAATRLKRTTLLPFTVILPSWVAEVIRNQLFLFWQDPFTTRPGVPLFVARTKAERSKAA
jgi:hypothetical protein